MSDIHYFNEKAETMSRSALDARQDVFLRRIVRYTMERNHYFRQRFEEAGINPETFSGMADLAKLPLMSKEDFRAQFPLGMSCVPENQLAEMHMSSGSTGTPVVMPYTNDDLAQWAECMARCYIMAGGKTGDVTQITPGLGLFNGGFGCYHGARKAGMFILPCGPGNTQRQVTLAKAFHTRVLTGVVSYAVRIMEVLEEMKTSLPELEIGIFGAEAFSPQMKEHIQSGLGIEAFDIYGMTETGGIGTLGMDCPGHNGIHLWEDQYIAEIIDPETGRQLPDGELGELVITSLTRQALPVIRFRTKDLTRILSRDICPACGRTHLRLETISGRSDDMLIIKGVNFFPKQVEQSLLKIPGVHPNYQLIIEEVNGVRNLRVNVEAEPGVTGFTVAKQLKEDLGFAPDGDVFAPGTLPRQEGKAKRVFFKNDK